jgi:putative transposase
MDRRCKHLGSAERGAIYAEHERGRSQRAIGRLLSRPASTIGRALARGETGFDPIEERLRETVRATIEALFDEELAAFLGRLRYDRGDGAPGLEAALVGLWGENLPIRRCTVHKHRNLLAHAPKHLHDERTEDDRDMICAATAAEVETRRKAFLRKWRLKCRAVADSLEEAGERLSTFTRLDPSQWKSARTTNAIERLNEEFRRRIKTQTVLPCAETVPMLLWALLASGQIQMRKVDGWETLSQPLEPMPLDLAA